MTANVGPKGEIRSSKKWTGNERTLGFVCIERIEGRGSSTVWYLSRQVVNSTRG
jgi:hypothetical protein